MVTVTCQLVKNAYAVPFEDKFDENTKRDYFTTIDANHDGITIFRHYSWRSGAA